MNSFDEGRKFAQGLALEDAIQDAIEARVDLDHSPDEVDRSHNQRNFKKKLDVLRRTERRLGVARTSIPEER